MSRIAEKKESYLVSSLDQGVVFATLDGKLDAEAKALQVRVSRVTEENRRVDLRLVNDLLLSCARADELEGAEEACCAKHKT